MKYLESLNKSLHSLFEENEKVFLIGEDILDPYGGAFKVSRGLSDKYPDRVITMPISEATIVGFGTGLAIQGNLPIVEIMFGDFITLIADQIINGAVKFNQMYNNKVNVPLVIRAPMGGYRGYGPTHSQTLETLFLNVPNLKIIAPSHFHEPGNLLKAAVLNEKEPVLFIENKLLYPQELINAENIENVFDIKSIETEETDYPIIKIKIKDDSKADLLILCYGGMAKLVSESVKNIFLEEEIITDILIPSIIKPLPINLIKLASSNYKKILIIEESVEYSGWGAELSSQIHENSVGEKINIKRLGAKSFVIPSSKKLEEYILPGVNEIKNELIKLYNEG